MATPADRAHRLAQQRLATTVGARLDAMIRALPDPMAQSSMDAYNRAAAKLVAGAQRRSAQLSIAYLGTIVPPRRPPSPDAAIEDVRVTQESPVTRSPILRVWGLVTAGTALVAALENAGAYASTLSSNDLAVAERGGLGEAADASGERIVGWRKELSDDACDWCQGIADQLFSGADLVPFHPNDACSVAPVLEGEE